VSVAGGEKKTQGGEGGGMGGAIERPNNTARKVLDKRCENDMGRVEVRPMNQEGLETSGLRGALL